MNLYKVSASDYEWCCFVFDTSRNRAKMRAAAEFGEDYINMRCKTLVKGVNVPLPVLVDRPEHEGYELVQQLGYHYQTDEF